MLATVFGVYIHQKVLGTDFSHKPQCHTAPAPQPLMEKRHKSGLWEVILVTWLAWVEMAAVWTGSVYSSFNLYLLSSSSTSRSLVWCSNTKCNPEHYILYIWALSPQLVALFEEVTGHLGGAALLEEACRWKYVTSQLPVPACIPCFSVPLWTLDPKPKETFFLKLILAMVFFITAT